MAASEMQIRLVRASHAEDGTSVFSEDRTIPPFYPFGPTGSCFAIFDSRDTIPVNNMEPIPSFEKKLPRCPPSGAMFCITEFQAGGKAIMHRSTSIDYCIVLTGEIVLVLEGGDEKTVKAGEFIVQQGTNHTWENRGSVPCRLGFVMMGSESIVIDGKVLESTVFTKTPKVD